MEAADFGEELLILWRGELREPSTLNPQLSTLNSQLSTLNNASQPPLLRLVLHGPLSQHVAVNHMFRLALVAILAGLPLAMFSAEPHIHTSRTSPKILPLPKGDDVFHFIVFGDRTGGPAEGIKVLAQAVEDANLLDPDLVMTVGDLVNGYNQTDAWMKQMEEFQATMSKLKRPWFPVAGNHDIYWRRAATNAEPKPPREHEASYEKHFGPLWYWFEHKNTGFLVLFSDEGHPDGRPRNFGDREQQQISKEQMSWIAAELEKMRRLKHIFVFLHHPFWWGERYPGNNWDAVHKLLVKNGNVRAVLAGHIHQMRYDGERDGIGYYALATTGGSLTEGMEYQYFGLLHHFNVVTVRDSGFSMAAIPVGGVLDPKQFTPARLAEVDAARYLLHEFLSAPISLRPDGSAAATYQVAVSNSCALPIDMTLLAKTDPFWVAAPDHRHAKLEPGQRKVFEFGLVREAGALADYESPEFELRFDLLTPDARLAMPNRSRRAHTTLAPPADGWPAASTNGFFVFDGKDDCLEIERERVPQVDGPFTVEAWVKPIGTNDNGSLVSNLRVGGFGLDIARTPVFTVQTDARGVDARRRSDLKSAIVAKGADKLPLDQWSHVAGVYDGRQITLHVNGQKAASTNALGARLDSDKSIYVGARPNGGFNVHNVSYPSAFWSGAVDEVRVSRGARYTKAFKPARNLAADSSTLFVLSNDYHFGPFVPVRGSARPDALEPQAVIKGEAKLVREGGFNAK
jgi:3',5'-cyclic AMP phosphodiesterase CpdA